MVARIKDLVNSKETKQIVELFEEFRSFLDHVVIISILDWRWATGVIGSSLAGGQETGIARKDTANSGGEQQNEHPKEMA